MTAISLPARTAYACVGFVIGAILGFFLAVKLLILFGSVFHDDHPSMQGFAYFMISLDAAVLAGLGVSLAALTLPGIRKPVPGRGKRRIAPAFGSGLCFLFLLRDGSAIIFALAASSWLLFISYITYVRYGVSASTTPPPQSEPQSS